MPSYPGRLGNVPIDAVKAPVVCVALTNETLTNVGQTISGVVIAANDRVLVTNQTTTTENGIWVALANQSWVRAKDMNNRVDVTTGQIMLDADTGDIWQVTAPSPWSPGSNSLTFAKILGSTSAFLDQAQTVTGDWTFTGTTVVPEATVTSHQAALTILEAQISDLDKYTQAEVDAIITALGDTYYTETEVDAIITALGDTYYTETEVDALTWAADDIVSGTFADALIAESNVTQHEGALTITEAQISDLGSYITGIDESDIEAALTSTSQFDMGNYSFDTDQTLGAGQDDYVLTYDNSTGVISLEVAAAADPGVIQTVYTQDGEVATGTTALPHDDTIPQNTEGFEVMTLSITPQNTSNILKIEVHTQTADTAGDTVTTALFQDSIANALAAIGEREGTGSVRQHHVLTHWMVAGTTSSTTFKVRIGSASAGTVTFNGSGGSRIYGGVASSSISITEYKA